MTEIERLRDELAEAEILTSNMGEEIKELRAEIKRLKKQVDCGHSDLPQECYSCGWRRCDG